MVVLNKWGQTKVNRMFLHKVGDRRVCVKTLTRR